MNQTPTKSPGRVVVIVMVAIANGMAAITALAMILAMSIGSPGPTVVQFFVPLLPSLFTAILTVAAIFLMERGWLGRALLAAATSLAIIPGTALMVMFR